MGMNSMRQSAACKIVLLWAVLGAATAFGQVTTKVPAVVSGAKPVSIERIKIHGKSLVGNLEGNAVDRDVLVVLPPSYASQPARRYPVVYALHGYSIGAEQWAKEIHLPQTAEGAFAKGARDMIVVLPDSKTLHNGAMYSNSPTTGGFEDYVSRDVVTYIDAHYRTIADRNSRGLAGHSMGGYGATRIGMKHSDVFGALYLMSPCCLSPRDANIPAATPGNAPNPTYDELAKVQTAAEAQKLPFGSRAQLAAASAWSPNPKNPPLFIDLPVGEKQAMVVAKWAANAPLAFVDQHIAHLRQYRAIAMDVGDQDRLRTDTSKLHAVLDTYGIANTLEIYPGTHTSDIAFRFQDFVLPFFSKTLSFDSKPR
jgi:enterochelin esterase-like enzyme